MITSYVKKVYVILKDRKENLEYEFEDFVHRVASGDINLDDIDFLTQEGQIIAKELQKRNLGFTRK